MVLFINVRSLKIKRQTGLEQLSRLPLTVIDLATLLPLNPIKIPSRNYKGTPRRTEYHHPGVLTGRGAQIVAKGSTGRCKIGAGVPAKGKVPRNKLKCTMLMLGNYRKLGR